MQRVGSGSTVIFSGDNGLTGEEPFVSAGTFASTALQEDIFAGGVGSNPGLFVRAGTWVFFVADDETFGRELFGVPVRETGSALAEPYGKGCSSASAFPQVGAAGTPSPGSLDFAVELSGASPLAACALLLGASVAEIPLGSCTLLVTPAPVVILPATATAQGSASVSILVPNDPALIGGLAAFQWVVTETGGPFFGVAGLSDGLLVIVGS